MPYIAPSVADFQSRFPRFAATGPVAVQSALDEGARSVDETWTEGDFAMGRMLYAAHVLTLEGFGEGAESQAMAQGMGVYSSMTSGSLSLTRAGGSSSGGGGMASGFGSTSYGLRFLALLRRNFAGVAVAGMD